MPHTLMPKKPKNSLNIHRSRRYQSDDTIGPGLATAETWTVNKNVKITPLCRIETNHFHFHFLSTNCETTLSTVTATVSSTMD